MEEKKLTYELICAALHGEPQAQEEILNYYDEYINTLAMAENETESGEKVRFVDEDVKAQIQLRLLEATKKWRAVQ